MGRVGRRARGQAFASQSLAPGEALGRSGFAADLDPVVDFYDTRFNIKFTKQEKTDLVAFLRSL